MVASISSSTVSNWADSVFSKLDTKNQGYIEKSDLQTALTAAGEASGKDGQSVNVDATFSALDGNGDGKVTKLGDQLNAQFDASRVSAGGAAAAGGPGAAGGPHGAHGAHGGGHAHGDGDGDGGGTVSDAEQAADDSKAASGKADSGGSASGGTEQAGHQKDPMRELAHALDLLKAYAENSGSSDGTAASASSTGSVNVAA